MTKLKDIFSKSETVLYDYELFTKTFKSDILPKTLFVHFTLPGCVHVRLHLLDGRQSSSGDAVQVVCRWEAPHAVTSQWQHARHGP